MLDNRERNLTLFFLALAGLAIAVLSGNWEHISIFKPLCRVACRETAEMGLLSVPFWVWGAAFYAVVAVVAFFRSELAIWIIAPAAGTEAALVWTLIRMKAPCIFCIANALVILFLLIVSLRKKFAWQAATLALVFLIVFSLWIPYENHPAGEALAGTDTGIAAKIGDEVVTRQRLEVLLGSRLFELKNDIYRIEKERLDQLIVETLLEKEADKKGISLEQLIEEVAPASRYSVSDEEVDTYLRNNAERLRDYKGTQSDLRDRVRVFLLQQKRSQAINAYAHELEPKYAVQTFLSVPVQPEVKVDIEGAETEGPADAPVTVVEFSDYECPACRATHETVKKIKETYQGKIRWVYKDYPLKRHKDAFKAAEAAHCAGDQGKFWEFQEKLFTADKLDVDSIVKYAGEFGLSTEKFSQCLKDSKHKELVEKNERDGVKIGVDRTPSFVINGTVFVGGPTFEKFKTIIDDELKKTAPNR
jgi:protein-disulfide isomerase